MRIRCFWLFFINRLIDSAYSANFALSLYLILLRTLEHWCFWLLIFILWVFDLIFGVISLVLLTSFLCGFLVPFSSFEMVGNTVSWLLTVLCHNTLLKILTFLFRFLGFSLFTLDLFTFEFFCTTSSLIRSKFCLLFTSDFNFLHGCIHIKLHCLSYTIGVVDDFILSYRHFFSTFKVRVSKIELFVYFSLTFDTFDNIIDIEHKEHLSFCIPVIGKLIWG